MWKAADAFPTQINHHLGSGHDVRDEDRGFTGDARLPQAEAPTPIRDTGQSEAWNMETSSENQFW